MEEDGEVSLLAPGMHKIYSRSFRAPRGGKKNLQKSQSTTFTDDNGDSGSGEKAGKISRHVFAVKRSGAFHQANDAIFHIFPPLLSELFR
jgi:hypothetical protein